MEVRLDEGPRRRSGRSRDDADTVAGTGVGVGHAGVLVMLSLDAKGLVSAVVEAGVRIFAEEILFPLDVAWRCERMGVDDDVVGGGVGVLFSRVMVYAMVADLNVGGYPGGVQQPAVQSGSCGWVDRIGGD